LQNHHYQHRDTELAEKSLAEHITYHHFTFQDERQPVILVGFLFFQSLVHFSLNKQENFVLDTGVFCDSFLTDNAFSQWGWVHHLHTVHEIEDAVSPEPRLSVPCIPAGMQATVYVPMPPQALCNGAASCEWSGLEGKGRGGMLIFSDLLWQHILSCFQAYQDIASKIPYKG
jgi:hypothetical protein